MTTCACGCGQPTSPGKAFRRGHNRRKHPSPAPATEPCACGCGVLPKPGKRYLSGHQSRTSPVEYVEEDRGYVTPCRIWQRARTADGLGLVSEKGSSRSARRVVYERERGPIPTGHVLVARCRVAPCVHPDHMDALTHADALRLRGMLTSASRPTRETCRRGHPMTPENVKTTKHGRQCRICQRKKEREAYARKAAAYQAAPSPPMPTDPPETLRRCRNGHVIAGENASPRGDGRFCCRICVNERAQRRYHRQKQRSQRDAD